MHIFVSSICGYRKVVDAYHCSERDGFNKYFGDVAFDLLLRHLIYKFSGQFLYNITKKINLRDFSFSYHAIHRCYLMKMQLYYL